MNKKVKILIPAFDVNMGSIILKQALPTQNVPQVDPFLLLHHANFTFDPHARAIHQGLGPHPHRGFTPVTFVIDGEVHHRDSRGNNQVAKKGEVQWMHAGAGIIHSERPSQELVERDGKQEVIQLWVNSPSVRKMVEPKYQYISEEKIPVFTSADQLVKSKVITGIHNNIEGRITAETDLLIIWSDALANGKEQFSIPKGFHSMIYLIEGELMLTNYGLIEKQTLAVLETDGDTLEITVKKDSSFLILAGAPINEKLIQQGPFVMNTETEILEAMRDYQMGKMGILIEE